MRGEASLKMDGGRMARRRAGRCVAIQSVMMNVYTPFTDLRYELPSVVFGTFIFDDFPTALQRYRIDVWMTTHHTGNGCQRAMYLWWSNAETLNGEGSTIRIVGITYPSIIESGSICKSSVEMRRTLLDWFPGNGLATGDVSMCRKSHHGTVTVNVIFCTIKPTVPTLRELALIP